MSNSVRQPKLRVHKQVVSLVDANDRFTSQIRTGGDTGTIVSSTTSSPTTGGGVLTTGGVATYNATGQYQATIGTVYSITETISAGSSLLNQYSTSINCTNAYTGSSTVLPTTSPYTINPIAGDDISCTLSNSIKQPLMRVHKVVDGLRNNNDRFTTQIRTGGVSGTVVSSTTNSPTTGGGALTTGNGFYQATGSYQAIIGTSYTLTEILSAGSSTLGQYNSSISCTNARTGAVTVLPSGSTAPFNVTPVAGDDITCIFTNVGAAVISGRVFYDNGKNAAIPHNGIQEVDELGIGNISLRLTDCGSTVYQIVTTDGAGDYEFTIPTSLIAGANLCVEEYQQPSNLVSVSGSAGSTGGSYSLASDRTQFTLALNTSYTSLNFGDVAQSQLTGTGTQTIAAGMSAAYGHQFIAGTEGSVTFSTAQASTPLLSWTSLVYLDNNCNALLDGGDTQITTAINVVAEQVLCLVQKVQSPSTANNGAQNISTLSASFVYTAPSVITGSYSQIDTTMIMDSGLVLVKKVREVSSCPSTGADVNPFITNNQALPNALIEYQIVYSNPSSNVVSDIIINDMTPSFTTFRSATCHTTPSSVLCSVASSPSVGGVGSLQWHLTDNPVGLGSGQSGEVRFCVRVDQ